MSLVSTQERLNKLQTLPEDLENVALDDISHKAHMPVKRCSSAQYVTSSGHQFGPGPGHGLGTIPGGLGFTAPPRRPSDNMVRRHTSGPFTATTASHSRLTIMERPVSNDSITTNGTSFSDFLEDMGPNSRNSSMTSGSVRSSPLTKNLNFSTQSIDHVTLGSHVTPSGTTGVASDATLGTINSSSSPEIPPRLRHTISTPRFFPSYQKNRPKSVQSLNISGSSGSVCGSGSGSVSGCSSPLPSTSTLPQGLTPSQKLRLKRQNSRSSSKFKIVTEREKYYDLNSDDDDTLEDGFIWNVPFTHGAANIFSPSSGTNPHLIKAIMDQSPVMLPMSPLPGAAGACSMPISPVTNRSPSLSSQNSYTCTATSSPNEAQCISEFYQASSENYVKKELQNRKKSSMHLPSMIKEASSLGLDDLKLVSDEKAKSLSSTRPIWLPPKSQEESTKHERDITKMLEKASILDKLKLEHIEKQKKLQEKNVTRWGELVARGTHRNSTQSEMKKLCLKTKIPDELRVTVWSSVFDKMTLSSSNSNLKLSAAGFEIETYKELSLKFETLPSLPLSKVQELSDLVAGVMGSLKMSLGSCSSLSSSSAAYLFTNEFEFREKLLRLLKLLIFSKISIVTNFDEYLLSFLLFKFSEEETFNIFYSIKVLVLSDTLMNKFDNNLYKNSIMLSQLKAKEFKPDLEYLSSLTIMKILSKFNNLEIVYQFLDILILNTNYRTIYCLLLTVLKDFHFGFDDLTTLIEDKKSELKIDCVDSYNFFEKFSIYFKKFY